MCGLGPGRRQLIASVGLTSRTGLTELGVLYNGDCLFHSKEQDTVLMEACVWPKIYLEGG